jgi:hypothetical protein
MGRFYVLNVDVRRCRMDQSSSEMRERAMVSTRPRSSRESPALSRPLKVALTTYMNAMMAS